MNQSLFKTGNYFKARITRIEPALEAAFVDYGADRHGFLPLKDINGYDKSLHKEGSILTICISEEEEGQKGAQMVAPSDIPNDITVHGLIGEHTEGSNSTTKFAFLSIVVVIIAIVVFTST